MLSKHAVSHRKHFLKLEVSEVSNAVYINDGHVGPISQADILSK